MTDDEIKYTIAQFAAAARVVKQAGFTGVHVHGAHGYLMSQFLSARSNTRTDRWGGSLEKRARFLLETITAIRAAVGPGFPIGLKLNSSDFKADAIQFVGWLNSKGLDLLELSSVEQPKVFGLTFKDEGEDGRAESTIKREAFFIEFAAEIRKVAKMPVMVTGGFRSSKAMNDAIDASEVDLIGLGRSRRCPICSPQYPNLRRARSGPISMGLCAVSRWCEGCRNRGKAQLSSAVDRISERITLASKPCPAQKQSRVNHRKTNICYIFQYDMAEGEELGSNLLHVDQSTPASSNGSNSWQERD
ncbi:MAG TPA: hypothetical protein VNX69_13030 [Steroidobacteraceae bacterium]|jgi:2,4-dienoyl-CoA reductase-like NADH-dependent reductase (Old Yellow Enzyme family)|nr:hypothetical protein [Steroidobacteraceae bacterium]